MKIRCSVCHGRIGNSFLPGQEVSASGDCCYDSSNWEISPDIAGLYGDNEGVVFAECRALWEIIYQKAQKQLLIKERQAERILEYQYV